MPAESHQAVEQLVVAFPSAAAWIIVMLVGMVVILVAYMGRKFLQRMDKQDVSLDAIKDLLASEVKQLREAQHALDKRVTTVEAHCDIEGLRWGRRSTDHEGDR